MKLIDGIKQKGNPFNIPDCSRNELPKFFKEMGFSIGAEIGVYRGAYTELFCKEGLTMYAVDSWASYSGAGRTEQQQAKQDSSYEHTKSILAPYDCTLIRKTSIDALSDFKDGSLDFVYIDGDHEFSHIAADLMGWTKKVRAGGIVSGHDYYHTDPWARNVVCHVGPVVDAFVKVIGIENFYTLGRSKLLNKEAKNDKSPSWMFIRK